jgi:predicted unusual protein kinase regulating ubiquinone biosynthesis (AarF/ABC1/UbiB family)
MHLLTISANLREVPEIILPQPIIGYTTSRVLAMEFIPGTKVTELTRLERREIGGERLVDALFRAYLKQILRDGLFHADPHPRQRVPGRRAHRAHRPRHGGAPGAGSARAPLNLDQIAHLLAPHFDPNAAIRRHAADITRSQISRELSLSSLFSTAVELKNFVQYLPGRVNRILDRLADNELEVRVDAIDETRLMEGMQKVANRITLGLVLAALIVGAALLMDVPTSFQLFGYPGLAIMLFLAAVAGGAVLAVTILANDIRAKRKART